MALVTGTLIDLEPHSIVPIPQVEFARMEEVDGHQISPVIGWLTTAGQMDRESGTTFDGQYIPETAEIHSVPTFDSQDTYKNGSSGSGRDFDTTGSPISIQHPEYQSAGLFWTGVSAGATFSAVDHAVRTQDGLRHTKVLIRRGLAPSGSTGASDPRPYTRLELAYGGQTNLAIVINWGQFIRLDYYDGTAWKEGVSVLKEVGFAEVYMRDNHHDIPLTIIPDNVNNLIKVRFGVTNYYLKFSPPRPKTSDNPNATTPLPQTERYQLTGQSGWCQFWVWQSDFSETLNISKSARNAGDLSNLQNFQAFPNALGRTDADQTTLIEPYVDDDGKLAFNAVAQSNNPGREPATFSDIYILIPSVWKDGSLKPYPANSPHTFSPYTQWVDEVEMMDERRRIVTRRAACRFNNFRGHFTNAAGDLAAILRNANGITSSQRIRGILAGGYKVSGDDLVNVCDATVFGSEYKLERTLNQELLVDGWALPSAVHLVLDICQIHPKFRQGIPFWPYGPVKSSDGCPFPILPKGTGNNPKMNFPSDMTGSQVLMELANDGLPVQNGSRVLPFWTGTNHLGEWFFDAYDTLALPLYAAYTDYDPIGYNRIYDIEVETNTDDIRTALDFQGQDPFTGELLFEHFDLPNNIIYTGRRVDWFERQGRWCSPAYLATIAKSAAILCSLPTQTIAMRIPYDPLLHVGSLIYADARKLGRGGYFIPLMIQGRTGIAPDGQKQVCEMIVSARAAENLTNF